MGGVLGAGLYDLIDLAGIGSPEILLINCANIPGSFAYNANHHYAQVLGGLVALTNGENVNVVPLSSGATVYPGQVRVGSLGVGNAVAAATPGSIAKKIEVFDVNGVSLGYVPVYNSIT